MTKWLPASIVAAIALAASACGGDAVALDPVAKAADTTAGQSSEHVEFTGSVVAPDGTRLSMSGVGDFQNKPQLGQLTMSYSSSRGSGTMTEVLRDWTIYLTSPLFAGSLPDGKTWMSLDLHKAGKALGVDLSSYTGQTPGQMLERLKATGTVVRLGPATVNGVATTHYRATIDLHKIPNGDKIATLTGVTFEPAQVWIDRQGLLRRVLFAYSSPTLGSTRMRMDCSLYGEPVSVAVPDDSVTFDATDVASRELKSLGG